MLRMEYRVGLVALLAWGCTGATLRTRDSGALTGDGGPDGGLAPRDAAWDEDGPAGTAGDGPGVTVPPIDGGPIPADEAGLALRARLYSDTEVVRESWRAATSLGLDDGAFVEAVHGCGEDHPLVSVDLRGEVGNETGTTFRLTRSASGVVEGTFVRRDAPAIRCSISEGQLTVTLAEWMSPPPEQRVARDRAKGTLVAPCSLGEESEVSLSSMTVKGSFDLPVRRSLLACDP